MTTPARRDANSTRVVPTAFGEASGSVSHAMGIILLIVLLLIVLGGLPNLGFHSYGYGPSGLGGVLLLVVLVLLLTGRL